MNVLGAALAHPGRNEVGSTPRLIHIVNEKNVFTREVFADLQADGFHRDPLLINRQFLNLRLWTSPT